MPRHRRRRIAGMTASGPLSPFRLAASASAAGGLAVEIPSRLRTLSRPKDDPYPSRLASTIPSTDQRWGRAARTPGLWGCRRAPADCTGPG